MTPPDDVLHADVAILGGGFCGAMTAAQLLARAEAPFTIALVERRAEPGLGVAYGTTEAAHVLNVPAAGMSAYPDRPTHFLDWLRAQPGFEDAPGTTFAPRMLYGRYVRDVLAAAEAQAPGGVRLERVRAEAVGLTPEATGGRVALADGRTVMAARVVLALGHFPPADPPVVGAEAFYAGDRYIGEPWAPGALDRVGPDDDVVLIGAGLTAIDWALALDARGHRGRLHMVSRRGLLPQPHVPGLPPAAMPTAEFTSASTLMRWVRAAVARVVAEGGDWRQAVDGLRPQLQGIWRSLAPAEKRRFLRHARPYWEVHRHRTAPAIAERLAVLVVEGRLHVHAARVAGYTSDASGVDVALRSGVSLRAAWVVNCTGPEANFRKMRHALIADLLTHGLVRADALGMGIEVDEEGRVVPADGSVSAWLWALGPLRKGRLWETTAVPELRGQAGAIAGQFVP
jgi:uncharacterized NAD(P)/FAD-binding protein YdhS